MSDKWRVVMLDGRMIKKRATLHDAFAEVLRLPDYYGRNLDSLADCLSEQQGLWLEIRFCDEMCASLGSYGDALCEMLRDKAEENPAFRVTLEK